MRKTCAHWLPTLQLKIQDRSAGCKNRLSLEFSFTTPVFLETTNCDFHIFRTNKMTLYFKRAPVWDWHSESLKHVWIVWSCLNKQEKEKNQVISTHEWMLTSCKMSSSFGITQSSSEASLWEVRESGGRERKRLNVRERERESECFDTSNLWSLTFITTIIVEDLSTVCWIYNGSFRWMS